jgi:ankyrin repeat protein
VELAIRNLNYDIANIHVYVEALTLASANGNLKIVETVLRKVKTLLIGWVFIARIELGWTPLHEAARIGTLRRWKLWLSVELKSIKCHRERNMAILLGYWLQWKGTSMWLNTC